VTPQNRHVLLIQGATRSVQEKELLPLLFPLLSSVILSGRRRSEARFGIASDFEGAVVDRRSITAVEYEYEYEYM